MTTKTLLRPLTRDEKIQLERICASPGPRRRIRRAKTILLLAEGYTLKEAAKKAGISKETARYWRNRFNDGGLEAINDRPRTGRPRLFNDIQCEQIASVAQTSPKQLGLPYERWSLKRLAEYISTVFGTPISYGKVGKILRERGIRWF